jgi:hypothetical protein
MSMVGGIGVKRGLKRGFEVLMTDTFKVAEIEVQRSTWWWCCRGVEEGGEGDFEFGDYFKWLMM